VPPYPGDTLLVFGGYMGSTQMYGGFIPIFLSYWLGTVVTSLVLYELGKWKGEAILKTKFISRYFGEKHQDRAKTWVLKYGIITFFICKFIPGINSLMIIFGGIFKYNKIWAYIGIGVASLFHNIIFFSTGKAIGGNWDNIKKFLSIYNRTVLIVLLIVFIIYLVYWGIRKFKIKQE
jgi:membrane protein DedA with SNARE-associated domain